jgi:TonB family protein
MKRCGACGERFQSQFNFCPVDGQTLSTAEGAAFAYRPTIMGDDSLASRLAIQILFLVEQSRAAWPRFKADPFLFLSDHFAQIKQSVRLACARRNLMTGLVVSFAAVFCVVLMVTVIDRQALRHAMSEDSDDLASPIMINLQTAPAADQQAGVGAGANGRVGFNKGRGEGSAPTPARAQGGGGGGDRSQLAQSQGRIPQPSVIPAPISTTFARLPHSLPSAGVDIDPVLWKDLPFPNYGDPRSKSTTPSNGPGDGGGVGNGKGTGIGEGEGNGFGPGRNGNIGGNDNSRGCCGESGGTGSNPNPDLERVYRPYDVTSRARVLSKPEPQYTEEARRQQITGTVILSVVFSRTGQVTNIRTVQPLCCGLTEKAIAAARLIRFIPAMRGGQVVSTYMQLEYNFNLY